MNLLEERKKTAEAIAQGRYISYVLKENSEELNTEIQRRMSSFTSPFWADRNFAVEENKLVYTTLKKHRFVDMKTRQTEAGKQRKKSNPIHNKPIFGHLNNIVKDLTHGYTDAIKAKFLAMEAETNSKN